jgi:hypothetical protein
MYVLLIIVCPFVLFLLATVLSVLLPYTDSDCPFGIFTLFLKVLEPNTDGKFHQLLTINSRYRCYPVLRVSHVEQELFTLPGYLSLLPILSRIRVA